MKANTKILLHTCCGPCAVTAVRALISRGHAPLLFWYNPNIKPLEEYNKRKDSFEKYAQLAGLETEIQHSTFHIPHSGSLEPDAACDFCYAARLEKTAKRAKQLGLSAFSTTLLASPYQNFDFICKKGKEIADAFGLAFIPHDARANYRPGLTEAKNMGLYTQKYCGCGPQPLTAQRPKP